jgi:ZU5 domain
MISTNGPRILGASLVLGLAIFTACGGSTPENMASKFVKTASVGPEGATIRVTEADDPTIAGTSIVIPKNALKTATTINIGVSAVSVVDKAAQGSTAIGPVIDFEPSGTTFAVPVTMTIPVSLPAGASASHVAVEAVEADGSAREIPAVYAGGLATIQASGFTSFGGISIFGSTADSGTDSGAACTSDSECSSGEACIGGTCEIVGNCTTDSDCSSGETCLDNRCAPPPSDSGVDASDGGPAPCGDGVCEAGETCGSCPADCGTCEGGTSDGGCPSGETECSGSCVNTDSDPANCGACAHRCPSGICTAGVCS